MSKLWRNNVDLSWLNYVLIMLSTLVNNFFEQMISSSRDFKITNSQKGCNANFPCSWKMENGLLIFFLRVKSKLQFQNAAAPDIWPESYIQCWDLVWFLKAWPLKEISATAQCMVLWFWHFLISIGNGPNTWFDLPQ